MGMGPGSGDLSTLLAIDHKAAEIETHIHSGARWFGAAASASGEIHIVDRIGAGDAGAEAGVIVVDAGNDDWGAWTQILGSADTPVEAGKTHYDLHELHITVAENTAQLYMMQLAMQEDSPDDDPGDNDAYTESVYTSAGVGNVAEDHPHELHNIRAAAGTKVWMRIRAPNQNTSTLSFYFGLHEYDR